MLSIMEYAKNDDMVELIGDLYSILFQSNIEYHCIYIERSHNIIADTLSRLDFNTFCYLKPNASINMTTPSKIKYYGQVI